MENFKKQIEEIIDETFTALRDVLKYQRQDIPLIFPHKRDDTIRISEQELRFLFVRFLEQKIVDGLQYNHEPICYSVETPTRNKFSFTGKNELSGNIDLTIHRRSDNKRICIIEFKYDNVNFESDYDKLYTELHSQDNYYVDDAFGYFIQLLTNSCKGEKRNTKESVRDKITEYNNKYESNKFKHICYSLEGNKKDGCYLDLDANKSNNYDPNHP